MSWYFCPSAYQLRVLLYHSPYRNSSSPPLDWLEATSKSSHWGSLGYVSKLDTPKSHDLEAHVPHGNYEIARNWCITEYPRFCPVALRHRELLPHHQTPALQKLLGFLAVHCWLLGGKVRSKQETSQILSLLPSRKSLLPSSQSWASRHHHPPIWGKNTAPTSPSISSFSVPSAQPSSVSACWSPSLASSILLCSSCWIRWSRSSSETTWRNATAKRHGAAGPSRGHLRYLRAKRDEKGMKKDEKGT